MSKINLKIFKLILYSVIVIIIIAIAVISFGHTYKLYSWKKHTSEMAEAKLRGEVNKIQNVILSVQQIPQNLAYVLEFSRPEKKDLTNLVNALIVNNDEIFGTCVAFEPNSYDKDSTYYAPYLYKKDGKIISVNPGDTTYYYFSMDWYLLPKILNKPVWIEPYYDEGETAGNIVMTTYSVPFYSFDGTKEKLQGIVAVDISLEWLSKIVSSIKLYGESYSILVSEHGTVISSPNPQWPYNESLFSLAEEYRLPILREVGRDLQKGKSGFVKVGSLGTNREWWVYYMPIPANKWGVLLLVPED